MRIISSSSYYLCHACPRGTYFKSHLSGLATHVSLVPPNGYPHDQTIAIDLPAPAKPERCRYSSCLLPQFLLGCNVLASTQTPAVASRGILTPPLIPTSWSAKSCAAQKSSSRAESRAENSRHRHVVAECSNPQEFHAAVTLTLLLAIP